MKARTVSFIVCFALIGWALWWTHDPQKVEHVSIDEAIHQCHGWAYPDVRHENSGDVQVYVCQDGRLINQYQ